MGRKKLKESSTECSDVKSSKKVKITKLGGELTSKGVFTECADIKSTDVKSDISNLPKHSKVPKRRGRPKKLNISEDTSKLSTECDTGLNNNSKILKHLGYCSNSICNGSLTDGDFIEGKKTLLRCIRCGTRQRLSSLLLEKKTDKELFDNARNVLDLDLEDTITEDYSNVLPEAFADVAKGYDDWE